MLIVQYREEPSPQIGSLLPQLNLPECSGKALLDKIICDNDIASKGPRVAAEARDQGLNLPVERSIDRPFFRQNRPDRRGIAASVGFCICGVGVQIHRFSHRLRVAPQSASSEINLIPLPDEPR
jgi:hypothetical protein